MARSTPRGLRPSLRTLSKQAYRLLATSSEVPRKQGDISSVFVSLSGKGEATLSQRFADQKRRLIAGREDRVKRSWDRLLCKLRDEVRSIEQEGSSVIPSIDFQDI
jgi:hypothetical protein